MMTVHYPRCLRMKSEGTDTWLILFQPKLLVERAVLNVDKSLTFTNQSDVQRDMTRTNTKMHTLPSTLPFSSNHASTV